MGVVTKKSTIITNRDALPRVHNSSFLEGGELRQCVAHMEVATGDTSLSTYTLFQIPSNARISALSLYSDDMGSVTAVNIGLWSTTANGGAVVSAALFASALSVNAGAIAGVNQQFQAGVSGASKNDAIEKRIWEVLGLSADPNLFYDVTVQLSATCDAGGTLSMKLDYVI